jgi:hypothetical protein
MSVSFRPPERYPDGAWLFAYYHKQIARNSQNWPIESQKEMD